MCKKIILVFIVLITFMSCWIIEGNCASDYYALEEISCVEKKPDSNTNSNDAEFVEASNSEQDNFEFAKTSDPDQVESYDMGSEDPQVNGSIGYMSMDAYDINTQAWENFSNEYWGWNRVNAIDRDQCF